MLIKKANYFYSQKQDLLHRVIVNYHLDPVAIRQAKTHIWLLGYFYSFRILMKTLYKKKQIRGQLTMSLGCGAHQSISFPGNRFYCYGDVCRGTLSMQSGKHTAHSGLWQNILMVKSKLTYFQACIDYMQSCFCKNMHRRHLHHPPPIIPTPFLLVSQKESVLKPPRLFKSVLSCSSRMGFA